MSATVKERDLEHLAAYQRELYLRPRLRFLFFELTDKCNMRCRHCGSGCSSARGTFLATAAIERTLRSVSRAYDPGGIMVCLTGGEPMLHPRIGRIIRLSREMGFSVGMTTNGTLIDDMAAERLAAAGLDTVSVSIDGIGSTHDEFRCSPGSFERAAEAARALRRAGVEPQALTVVHRGNLGQLHDMRTFLLDEGFYSWRVVNVDPIGRACLDEGLLLSGGELRTLLDFVRDERLRGTGMEVTYGCSHFLGLGYEHMVRDAYFQCGAGTQVASVMANGDIGACLDIERRPDLVYGNAYSDDFVEVWEDGFGAFRRDRTEGSPACGTCRQRGLCLGDSAHTWDFDGIAPRYCAARMMGVLG